MHAAAARASRPAAPPSCGVRRRASVARSPTAVWSGWTKVASAAPAQCSPLPRRQHGQPRQPAHGLRAVGGAQLDPHVGGAGLTHLQQVLPVQRQGAGAGQHRAGRVPGQVPGLGDLAPAVVLNEGERHLQDPRRRLLTAARPGAQDLPLLAVGGGRVRAEGAAARAGGVRTRAGHVLREGQADRDRGRRARHRVRVADHGHAGHLDADGVQRGAADALAAVDGVDELADLGLAELGADEPEDLAGRGKGGPRPGGVEVSAADQLVAKAADLAQPVPQPRRQVQEVAPVVAAGGEDADLGGQVGQVGELRDRAVAGEKGAQHLGCAALAQSGAEVALQVGRQDAEESAQDKIAIIELHKVQVWDLLGRPCILDAPDRGPGRCRRTATTGRDVADMRRLQRPCGMFAGSGGGSGERSISSSGYW